MDKHITLNVQPSVAWGDLKPDFSDQTFRSGTQSGSLKWSIPDTVMGGAWMSVEADGFNKVRERVILPLTDGKLRWDNGFPVEDPLILTPGKLVVVGDRFHLGGKQWYWKGSTDFRLFERVQAGVDIRPVLEDRLRAGANLVRILSMKANNTGWEFLPKAPGHWEAVRKTFEILKEYNLFAELTVFADTKKLMPNQDEQQVYWRQAAALCREFPGRVIIELVNEDKHPTQSLNSAAFPKPIGGLLSSHGSGLADVQPVQPLWDYATYHARRSPPPPGAKPFNNLNPYEFHPVWPHPVPYVCEESVKPENYGFNPSYARQMGNAARLGPGATFHHQAWNECRPWTPQEFACAKAFYAELTS